MRYTLQEIKTIVNGQLLQIKEDTVITNICIDTRQITNAAGSLFFCLVARNDGHLHIETAYRRGIRNFIVSKEV